MKALKFSASMFAVAALLAVSGCGGGGGDGGGDTRDAIVGTWSGPMTPSGRASGSPRTITFQILKASASGDIQGTFAITIPAAARSTSTRDFDASTIFQQLGTFSGKIANGGLSLTMLAKLAADGASLPALEPFATATLSVVQSTQGAVAAALNGNYTAVSGETGAIAATPQPTSSATNIQLGGTTWAGPDNKGNIGGIHIQTTVPNIDKGTFPIDVTFSGQGGDNSLSGTIDVTAPDSTAAGSQSFPIAFSGAVLLEKVVVISGNLPDTAPPLKLGGFSVPLAGAAFNFQAAIDNSASPPKMGGPTSSGFSVKLPGNLLALAALAGFSIPTDANGYVNIGTATLFKTTGGTTVGGTGGITVPIK